MSLWFPVWGPPFFPSFKTSTSDSTNDNLKKGAPTNVFVFPPFKEKEARPECAQTVLSSLA